MQNESIKQTPKSKYTSLTTHEAGVLQATVNRLLQKHCDALLKPYGITKSQWLIIGTILKNGNKGIRVSELAKKLDTTTAYLTNIINLLESKNILTREAIRNDSRAKCITIHPHFIAQCDEIEAMLRTGLRKIVYSHIDDKEFETYMKVLYELSVLD